MSLLFGRPEQRSLSYQDVWGSGGTILTDIIQGGSSVAESGLRLVPVYAATSLIADLVSTAPLRAFRQQPDGTRAPLDSQPRLVVNPAPYGSRIDWIHQALTSMLLRGNAYGYITAVDGQGRPAQIQWLNPDDTTVVEEQVDWFHRPTYYWRGRPLDIELVVHIPAFTFPGSVVGYSPLALFKLQIETGLRAQKHGDDWFKNGANPSGQLKNSQRTVSPDEAQTVKIRYKSAVSKRDVFVTGADWDYKALSVNADESQFLQTIRANATQIAAIYRVSPEDVGGETATSLTYKTLEQDQTKLTSRTLAVWAARLETALTDLLPRPQYVRFDLDRMARGDLTSRMVAETAALSSGIHTLDEARASEDLPPLTPAEVEKWQAWYRTSAPVMPGVPNPKPPAPLKGKDGGPSA